MKIQLLFVFLQALAASALTMQGGATVSSDPPGPVYSASVFIKFFCRGDNHPNPGELSYVWYGFTNDSSSRESSLMVNDPIYDSNNQAAIIWLSSISSVRYLECHVFNSSGRVAIGWKKISVTGIGVRIDGVFRGELGNNTSVLNTPYTLLCESALNCTSSLQWRGPGLNESSTDCSAGYATARLSIDPSVSSGLYSCVSPDRPDVSSVFIGIYSDLDQRTLPFQASITTNYIVSNNHLSLSCSTSHLPASSVQWKRDSILLDQALYNGTTVLVDVTGAASTSHLSVDWSQDGLAVIECFVYTEWISDPSYPYYDSSRATGKFLVAELGSQASTQCGPVGGVSSYRWIGQGDSPLDHTPGLELTGGFLVVSEVELSHHGLQFSCHGLDSTGGIVYSENYTLIASVAADSVLTYLVDNPIPVVEHGGSHSITCCYNTSLSIPSPSLYWFENGLEIIAGITVDGQCSTLALPTVHFNQNGWVYTCSSQWAEPILSIGPSASHRVQKVLTVIPPPTTAPEIETTATVAMVPDDIETFPEVDFSTGASGRTCHTLPALVLSFLMILTIIIT